MLKKPRCYLLSALSQVFAELSACDVVLWRLEQPGLPGGLPGVWAVAARAGAATMRAWRDHGRRLVTTSSRSQLATLCYRV